MVQLTQSTSVLQDFVEWFNKGTTDKSILSKVYQTTALEDFSGGGTRPRVSISSLGKPMVELALRKLGYFPDIRPALPVKLHMIFDFGHWFERYLICLMEDYGIYVQGYQQTVEFLGLVGHIDFYLGDTVIDVKTMSDDNFKRFVTKPHDGLGYVTQLSLYGSALNKKGGWLIYNKASNELRLVHLDEEIKMATLETATDKLTTLNSINKLEDIAYEPVPSPIPEVFKKQETGKFLIPPSMHNNPYMSCLYRLEPGVNGYGVERLYVTGIIEGNERIDAINELKNEMELGQDS